jgi:divalent metal cation (Fe/Co/Zn/Cd) transporter
MDTVRRYAMLIDGDWVDTEDRFEIGSPATEELVASVAKGGREHADRAVLAAKAVHRVVHTQGVAAVLIGLILIRTSLRLVKRSHDFLVGAWPLTPAAHGDRDADGATTTQPLGPADEERVRAFLLAYPGVTAIHEVLVTFLGPGQAWVIARLDIDDDLGGAQVKSLVRGIESGMKRESENIYRVDIVPIDRAQAA